MMIAKLEELKVAYSDDAIKMPFEIILDSIEKSKMR